MSNFYRNIFVIFHQSVKVEIVYLCKKKIQKIEIFLCLLPPQCLPYSLLLQQLELKNVRELEDLLIEAVYCDIIQGKLDQRNQQVEVDCSVGRDLGPNELPNIINTLQEWSVSPSVCLCTHFRFMYQLSVFLTHNLPPLCSCRCTGCEAVLCGIEEQVSRANQYRESQLKVKVQVETEVSPSAQSPPLQ